MLVVVTQCCQIKHVVLLRSHLGCQITLRCHKMRTRSVLNIRYACLYPCCAFPCCSFYVISHLKFVARDVRRLAEVRILRPSVVTEVPFKRFLYAQYGNVWKECFNHLVLSGNHTYHLL